MRLPPTHATISTTRERSEQSLPVSARGDQEHREGSGLPAPGPLLPRVRVPPLAARGRRPPRLPAVRRPSFGRDSIFEPMQDHAPRPPSSSPPRGTGARLAARGAGDAPRPRPFLAILEDEEIRIFEIEGGWTRIGRSVAADLRLDDPSVSRRHALIVSESPRRCGSSTTAASTECTSTASWSSGLASATETS